MSYPPGRDAVEPTLPASGVSRQRQRILFWLLLAACAGASFAIDNPWGRLVPLAGVAWGGVRIAFELLILGSTALSARIRWKYERGGHTGPSLVVPNPAIQGEAVRRLLGHPDLKSKRAHGLRQLIYWWQVPATECHQEIMEQGDVYRHLRPATGRLLAQSEEHADQLIQRCIDEALQRHPRGGGDWSMTRLRSIVGPMVMPFFYEYALGRRCPPELVPDLLEISNNLSASVASVSRRDLSARLRLLEHLRDVLERDGGRPDVFGEHCPLTIDQRAQYVQGVWMQTAAAQLVRLAGNALCLLARHPRCLEEVLKEQNGPGPYMESVLNETLRVTPGTRLTNRFATGDIDIDGVRIERGTNVLFAFKSYQRTGFARPDEFIPERWRTIVRREANFVPFGLGQRRCPAERLTFQVAAAVVRSVLAEFRIRVPPEPVTVLPQPPQFRVDDACCIVRGKPPGRMTGWLVDQRLRVTLALNELRRAVLPAFVMPRDARDAFAAYPVVPSDAGITP